jgi:nicotinamide-nucleotide adenylyltransferase
MTSIAAAIARVQSRLSAVELVSFHPKWPLPASSPTKTPLRISVLDSSFNPPTIAHLALANSLPPAGRDDYNARLLLLSVYNADKTLKSGDATHVQRIEMMRLLSHHITHTPDNVAVAIVGEPTFVEKSSQLLSFLKQRILDVGTVECPPIQLFFILGFDTLERIFAPRYYGSVEQMHLALRKFLSPPPDGDDSYVVCARRNDSSNHSSDPSKLQYIHEFISSGRIVMIDIGATESIASSTLVRNDSSWKSYVNDSIAQYIQQNGLYMKD